MTLLIHTLATCFMTGLIWFVQIVHYPMFRDVGADQFVSYEEKHRLLTTWVVGPVMLVELVTAILLLRSSIDHRLATWGLILVVALWLSTAFIQVPLHQKLTNCFDDAACRWLVRSNWLRTIIWSLRAVIVLTMVSRQMKS